MTPTQKDLIDTDGENRAVRAFLLGREVGCKDYEQMRRHMTNSGFNNCWPSEFAGLGGHMSKGDQQMWLRHLFALERLGALAEQPAEQSAEPVGVIEYLMVSNDGWLSKLPPGTDLYTQPPPTKRVPLTIEAVRQEFERIHGGTVGATRIKTGEYLSPQLEKQWLAFARKYTAPCCCTPATADEKNL